MLEDNQLQNYIEKFQELIKNKCGMQIIGVHISQLKKHLEFVKIKRGLSVEEFYSLVLTNPDELTELLNAMLINETYFFREERQFAFLRNHINKNFAGKRVTIWSAACSTGEEPYSLASLAIGCNAFPIVYATDIDTDALIQVKNGMYGNNSFRSDGKEYKKFLDPFLSETTLKDGRKLYAISPDLKQSILCGVANLVDLSSSSNVPADETVDIIFIRNVFIYFNEETRIIILKNLAKKLKKGGLLFFSVSEIAGIDAKQVSDVLEKQNTNTIYYFVKKAKNENSVYTEEVRSTEATKKELLWTSLEERKNNFLNKVSQEVNKIRQDKPILTPHPMIPKTDAKLLWKDLLVCVNNKKFSEAEKLIESFQPTINQLHLKYYFTGYVNSLQNKHEDALMNYEKATLSKPDFWPGYYQLAMLLESKNEDKDKKRRYKSLVKVATILETDSSESKQYDWLMENFSVNYFYNVCTEYLKKEINVK